MADAALVTDEENLAGRSGKSVLQRVCNAAMEDLFCLFLFLFLRCAERMKLCEAAMTLGASAAGRGMEQDIELRLAARFNLVIIGNRHRVGEIFKTARGCPIDFRLVTINDDRPCRVTAGGVDEDRQPHGLLIAGDHGHGRIVQPDFMIAATRREEGRACAFHVGHFQRGETVDELSVVSRTAHNGLRGVLCGDAKFLAICLHMRTREQDRDDTVAKARESLMNFRG